MRYGQWRPLIENWPEIAAALLDRLNGTLVRTITVAATFESVADVTLDEVRVELVYPEDAASDQFFRAASRDHEATSEPP